MPVTASTPRIPTTANAAGAHRQIRSSICSCRTEPPAFNSSRSLMSSFAQSLMLAVRVFRSGVLQSNSVFQRVIWIVLDSVGIGAMPDAAAFHDPPGADTLGNIARLRGLALPNLGRLGLGNIKPLTGIAPATCPEGAFGRCALASPGKDTTTGHWKSVV